MHSAKRRDTRSVGLCALGLALLAGATLGDDPRAVATPATTRSAPPAATVFVGPATVEGFPGVALVCTSLGEGCTELTDVTEVPSGTFVYADVRAVEVGRNATTPDAFLYDGVFQLVRGDAPGDLLVARLAGGDFAAICGTGPPPKAAPAKGATTFPQRSPKVVRGLHAGVHAGGLRIVGGYASATVSRGSTSSTVSFLARDSCAGTSVVTGTAKVLVNDPARRTSTTVTRGRAYLARAPALKGDPGVTTVVEPVKLPGYDDPVTVCKQPKSECQTLTGQTLVPFGSHIDTLASALKLSTVLANGKPSHMVTSRGLFQLLASGTTIELKLEGGDFKGICGDPGLQQRGFGLLGLLRRGGVASVIVRSQKNKGRGKLRSDAGTLGAASQSTEWFISNTCARNFVRVVEGSVTVFDRARGRTLTLRAPKTYSVPRERG